MKEQEASVNSITEQKAKIRLRYQGIDPNLLVVLPAKTETGLYDDTVHRRVAVYARVSTDDPHQTSSYELQKNYYVAMSHGTPTGNLSESMRTRVFPVLLFIIVMLLSV